MLQFGFELEGFYYGDKEKTLHPSIPPKSYPVDGFPGLVELRTSGGKSLDEAIQELYTAYYKLNDPNVSFRIPRARFHPKDLRELRARGSNKVPVLIQNLYCRPFKALGNYTIASFQISVSNLVSQEYRVGEKYIPAHYTLLDVAEIVRQFDKEFEKDIRDSGRQPGCYAIKRNRLEYRSLPNFVALDLFDGSRVKVLRDRIWKCAQV